MQLVTRSTRLVVLVALALASKVSAQADLPVYADHLLNDFQDWNSAPHSLTNTSPVHSGTYSISVSTMSNWSGLSLYHADLDTSPYASLSFWINGGNNGGQRLQVQGMLGGANPPENVYFRFSLLPDTWQQITVPLASLGVADKTNFTGAWIQLTPGGASDTFYIDDIQFNVKPMAPFTVILNTNIAAVDATPRETGTNWRAAAWWIVGALVVIIGLLAWLVTMLRKSGLGKSNALVPAYTTALPERHAASALAGPSSSSDWKQRALAAEATTGNQAQNLRDEMVTELTEFAKQSLVQGLYTQRNALIETQQKAQQALAELESRLAALHLPQQDRIHVYEKRIAELEKELETRGDEMRELIRATLLLVRQKLEEEKGLEGKPGRFN